VAAGHILDHSSRRIRGLWLQMTVEPERRGRGRYSCAVGKQAAVIVECDRPIAQKAPTLLGTGMRDFGCGPCGTFDRRAAWGVFARLGFHGSFRMWVRFSGLHHGRFYDPPRQVGNYAFQYLLGFISPLLLVTQVATWAREV